MDGILTFHYNIHDNLDLNAYKNVLENHQSIRLAQVKSSDPIINNITKKLGKSESQKEALVLLYNILKQCNLDVIEQKGNQWTAACIKICNQSTHCYSVSQAYDVLGLLIEKSCEISELGKAFSTNYIGKICETLHVVEESNFLSALKCIFICLKKYPGPCGGSSRNTIEKFIINHFPDSTNIDLVRWSGKCFHLMQQVKGGGVQGANHKVLWNLYQIKLLGSLHEILDTLFSNCPEFYDYTPIDETLPIKNLTLNDDPFIRASQLSNRFKNLIHYLIIALRDFFPVSKSIQPKKILSLIKRGLFITCEKLKRNAVLEDVAVGAVLPEIHIELFKLLENMILILKNHLNIYNEEILGFFVDTLKWTSSGKSEGFKKPYCDLRCSIYETLTVWCQTLKFASCAELIFEQIFKEIQYDTMPFKNEITLNVSQTLKKHMSKKARRQLHKLQNVESHIGQVHMKTSDLKNIKIIYNDNENKNLCISALAVLKELYTYCSSFLNPLLIKEIHEIFIEICLSLNEAKNIPSALYSSNLCRLNLYEVLACFVFNANELCPPPGSLILHLLNDGQINDSSKIVRDNCTKLLKTFEKILHPQKQSLHFPQDLNGIRHALKLKQHQLIELLESSEAEDAEEESDNEIEVNETTTINNTSDDNYVLNHSEYLENCVDVVDGINQNDANEPEIGTETITLDKNTVEIIEILDENINENKKEIESRKEKDDDVIIVETNEIVSFANHDKDLNEKNISSSNKRSNIDLTSPNHDKDQNEQILSPKRTKFNDEIHEISLDKNVAPMDDFIEDFEQNDDEVNESLFKKILSTFTDEMNEG